jgi:hypothetical protein
MSGTCPSCKVAVPPGHTDCLWCDEPLQTIKAAPEPDRVETLYDDHGNDGPSTLRLRNTDEMAALRPTEIMGQEGESEPPEKSPRAHRSLLFVALLAVLGVAGVVAGAFLGSAVLDQSMDARSPSPSPPGAIVEAPVMAE